jgi:hypothetical protein
MIKETKKGKPEYRTATTAYPCYIPVLGGSAGAGRIRLTHRESNILWYSTQI